MNRTLPIALVLVLSACFKGSPSVGTCSTDADCSPGSGSTCNVSLHVCAYACDHVCASDELCVNGSCSRKGPAIGLVTVTDNPAALSNGYYPRSDTVSVPVSVPVDFGDKVNVGDANLVINGGTLAATSKSVAGHVKTFLFQVPTTTAQAAGKETPIPFKVVATDTLTTNEQTPLATLKIDDAPPVVTAVATIGGVTVNGVQWFQQSAAGDIEIQADIVDNGSGVDASSLQLLALGPQRLDHGTPTIISGNRWSFKVARTIAGVIADGEEKLLTFDVKAADHLGHSPTTLAHGKVGIDGKPPIVPALTITYPALGDGCDQTATSTAPTSVLCGHDGAHFWRRGDAADGSDVGSLSFVPTDSGSGIAAGSGACAIEGSSKGCTVGANFTITPNFSDATLSAPDVTTGGGKATVTVTVMDAVGNVSALAAATPDVSRLRWARTLSALPTVVLSLAGAPIVTTKPVEQIILAGGAGTTDPIVALQPNGALLWHAGKAQGISAVTSNMAWDSTPSTDAKHPTPMLYVVATDKLAAIHVSFPTAGLPTVDPLTTGFSYNCTITNGAGSPVVAMGGAAPAVLVSDTAPGAQAVYALGPSTTGNACATAINISFASLPGRKNTRSNSLIGPPTMGPSGAVYFGYDNSNSSPGDAGYVTAAFALGAFTSATGTIHASTAPATAARPQLSSGLSFVAVATDLFFPSTRTSQYVSIFSASSNVNWVAPVFPDIPMVIAKGIALGASSGTITAYDKVAGALFAAQEKWKYGTGLGVPSPIATAADGTIYFSDATKEFVAVTPPVAGITKTWIFKGPTSVALSGVGNEPTISANGIVYFTDNATANGSNVYALITDSTSLPANQAEWPRTGFDNCNSGNSTFTGCQ